MDLIMKEGYINYIAVRILKDEGCNTKVLSKDLLHRHKRMFRVTDTCTVIYHSKNCTSEVARQVFMDA